MPFSVNLCTRVVPGLIHSVMNAFLRILVTGGAGFFGSAVCRHLMANTDAEVLNVDKLTYAGTLASLRDFADHTRYSFAQADIADTARMSELLCSFRPSAILHLAAETHVDRSIAGASTFVQTNVVGTFSLLEAARSYWSGLGEAERSSLCACVDRRGVRVPRRRGPLHGRHGLQSVLTLLSLEGRRRSSRHGLASHLWAADRHRPLSEHLWPVPISGEAHPPHDPQRSRGSALASLRLRQERSRVALPRIRREHCP